MRQAVRDQDIRDGVDTKSAEDRPRPAWSMPTLSEFDIVANTEITNCGTGSDGVICSSS